MRANIPSRKKIKLNWFKAKAEFNTERNVSLEYSSSSVNNNKQKWDVIVKYVFIKEGDPKEIPPQSPMTLYKGGLPFLFLSTSATIGNKIISEELIDSDILVDDDIVQVIEGKSEITFEDAIKPKEHIEVRTRLDKISRKLTIENKLDNEITVEVNFKQTKDVTFIKSNPEPSEIEEPNYKYKLVIPTEQKKRISLELQAKIISRVTRIKPEFIKQPPTRKYINTNK